MRFTVTLAPRTKKTSNQLGQAGGRMFVFPSKPWREWVASAQIEFDAAHQSDTWARAIACGKSWVNWPVNCEARFYRDARRGDACGYYQGLADLLQKKRILANDALIEQWDHSRLLVDRSCPRTVVVLRPVEG